MEYMSRVYFLPAESGNPTVSLEVSRTEKSACLQFVVHEFHAHTLLYALV